MSILVLLQKQSRCKILSLESARYICRASQAGAFFTEEKTGGLLLPARDRARLQLNRHWTQTPYEPYRLKHRFTVLNQPKQWNPWIYFLMHVVSLRDRCERLVKLCAVWATVLTGVWTLVTFKTTSNLRRQDAIFKPESQAWDPEGRGHLSIHYS
jgi:hypothetical protein